MRTTNWTSRNRTWVLFLTGGALALFALGCGPALIGLGADVAADGASRGTTSVAAGGSPGVNAVTTTAVGVAVMAAGYKLTPPDQRTPNAAGPIMYTPSYRHPSGRR